MHDLTRKFFHLLLRRNRFLKAFRLAVDLNDYDLFMDIHHAASRASTASQQDQGQTTEVNTDQNLAAHTQGLTEMAEAALIQVRTSN